VIWLSDWGERTGVQNTADYGGGPRHRPTDPFLRAVWAAEKKRFGGWSLFDDAPGAAP
jgi:hypothetical protein